MGSMRQLRLPITEPQRLDALRGYKILDTLPEQAYDDITSIASLICDAPIALISLVDSDRQWFKSKIGIDAPETPRDTAFCAHAILKPGELLIVPDANRDPRFSTNPLVTHDPKIRFYAGAPLVTSEGHALGTLCVIDRVPRKLLPKQQEALRALSRQVMAQLGLRRTIDELEREMAERRRFQDLLEKYQRRLEATNAHLEAQSGTDALTGLSNRRICEERLEEEIERARRGGHSLSLLMLDVDNFKIYNDACGHSAGDEALRQIARVLQEGRRRNDIVARYGGEEFIVILPNSDAESALIIAERFRRLVEAAPWEHSPITVSIGFAILSPAWHTVRDLIGAADQALYSAKRSGRNRVVAAGLVPPVGRPSLPRSPLLPAQS